MKTKHILRYPLLRNLYSKNLLIGKELKEAITNIQKSCEHEWDKNTEQDENIPVYFLEGKDDENGILYITSGVQVLKSKTCRLCGLEVIKPKGKPTEICHVCWADMKQENVTHMVFGTVHHMYKCTNPDCNNHSWHT